MEEKQSKIGKIIYWNLGIYFGISLLEIAFVKLSLANDNDYNGLFAMILSMFSIGLQVLINLGISIYYFAKHESDLAKSYLASLFLILLIGFPLCFIGLVIK